MGILMETQMSFRFVIVSFTFGETFIKLFLGEVQIARHLMEQWRWKILQQFLKTATEAFQLPNCQRRDDLFGHNGGSVSWWEPPSISEGWHSIALPLLFHINILNGLIPWKSYVYPFVSSLSKLDCFCANKIEAGLIVKHLVERELGWMQGCCKPGNHPPDLCLASYLPLCHCVPYHTCHSTTAYHTIPDTHLPCIPYHIRPCALVWLDTLRY